jgi:UDP-glucuronate decarboxylase
MKRVFVTGGGGFLGSWVLKFLVGRGYEVHACTRFPKASADGVTWHQLDMFRHEQVAEIMEFVKPYGLVHLAWNTDHGSYWMHPSNVTWVEASMSLASAFAQFGGVRLIGIGSSAEYDWSERAPLDEASSKILPASIYGACKNKLYLRLADLADTAGVSFSWARIFNLFGPNEKRQRLIPRVVLTMLRREKLLFDSGYSERDFLHVEDAASALTYLFESHLTGPVNIASGVAVKIGNLVTRIGLALDGLDLIHFSPFPLQSDADSVTASVARLRNELKWNSAIGFSERILQTCNWWREELEKNTAKQL